MENYVKTESIILAIWSAIMLQCGMLSTSYVTNVKSDSVQTQVMEQQAENTFFTYGLGEDLSGNETSLLTSMSNMEKKEEQESEEQAVQVKKVKETKTEEAEQKEAQESEAQAAQVKKMKEAKTEEAEQKEAQESEAQAVQVKKVKETKTEEAEQKEAQESEAQAAQVKKMKEAKTEEAEQKEAQESEAQTAQVKKMKEAKTEEAEPKEAQESEEQAVQVKKVKETKTEEAEQKEEQESEEQAVQVKKVKETKTEEAEQKEEQESEERAVQVKKVKETKTEEAEPKEAQEGEEAEPKQMKILKKKPAKQDKTEEPVSDEEEQKEAERLAKEKEEAERLAKEEAERLAKEEAERLAKEKAEAEAAARKLNTDPSTLTFLVNKEYVLPKNYIPKLVEPKVNHCQPIGSHKRYMREEAATALEEMFAAAKADGYDLWVKTAYRSYSNQYATYTWMLQYRGVQEAVYYHAVPGTSEHQTGLAVDIVCEASNYENELSFEKTEEYTWLKENCYKYGFTLRYWEGKEHITGYNYEPWHYRYVGVELATYLMEQELTLEEYYNALPTTDLFQVPKEYEHLIQDKTESK